MEVRMARPGPTEGDLFQWEGGPDCKVLDHNEDGGKLLAAHSLGAVPFACS